MINRVKEILTYGKCDCEYPCSCVEFEGKHYSGWDKVLVQLYNERQAAKANFRSLGDSVFK